jgi:hypothetical protein
MSADRDRVHVVVWPQEDKLELPARLQRPKRYEPSKERIEVSG